VHPVAQHIPPGWVQEPTPMSLTCRESKSQTKRSSLEGHDGPGCLAEWADGAGAIFRPAQKALLQSGQYSTIFHELPLITQMQKSVERPNWSVINKFN